MTTNKSPYNHSGFLNKWTNYIKGYQKRFFVLQDCVLSYYRNANETTQACRGSINLESAEIHRCNDALSFIVSNPGLQFHLKAGSKEDAQRWLTALERTKGRIEVLIDESEAQIQKQAFQHGASSPVPGMPERYSHYLADLKHKRTDVHKCHDYALEQLGQYVKQHEVVVSSVTELNRSNDPLVRQLVDPATALYDRASLVNLSGRALVNACKELMKSSDMLEKHFLSLWDEHAQLEKMVRSLASEKKKLMEEACKALQNADEHQSPDKSSKQHGENVPSASAGGEHRGRINSSCTSDQDSFEDAVSDQSDISIEQSPAVPSNESDDDDDDDGIVKRNRPQYGRTQSNDSIPQADGAAVATRRQIHVVLPKHSKSSSKEPPAPAIGAPKGGEGGDNTAMATKRQLPDGTTFAPKRVRRSTIPEKPDYPLNLWSFVKNCITKELHKIPLPVNFNEPLSMLQRIAEELEYSELLDRAAAATTAPRERDADVTPAQEQLALVAAFSVSSYSTTINRTSKPFNPLLGETFEFDRVADLGWRYLAEQVTHHPPVTALHTEAPLRGWKYWQQFSASSKFRASHLLITPLGVVHVEFADGNHYTFRKVSTCVHNIIMGSLWLEHVGEMVITNHTTGDVCRLKFDSKPMFSQREVRDVSGFVIDSNERYKLYLRGRWDGTMSKARVRSVSTSGGGGWLGGGKDRLTIKPCPEETTIWSRVVSQSFPPRPEFYQFTPLSIELNDPNEPGVAPTDSRFRQDQRLMETADWEGANKEKLRLEEAQRARRRQREQEAARLAEQRLLAPEYQPCWFRKEERDPCLGAENPGQPIYRFTDEYWRCKQRGDWSRCADIFDPSFQLDNPSAAGYSAS